MIQFVQVCLLSILFVFLAFGVFYTIGYIPLALQRKNLTDQEIISLSLTLGVVIFTLLAVGLAILNLRWLMLPALIFSGVFIVYKYGIEIIKPWKILANKTLLILVILGILTQGLINFPSGFLYKDGLEFWSSQGHDGLWHVSLMEEIRKQIPPQNPIFSGEHLYNYHYLVDVVMGEFLRIFSFFSSLDLYFRLFPILFSFMLGMSVFSLMTRWQKNIKIGYWAIFFTYFTGSFGYIVTFIKTGNLFGGETVFWAAQINTILGNPPHAISLSILSSFLLSYLFFVRGRRKEWFFICLIIGFCLAGFKVSGGFVMLAGLAVSSLADILFLKNFSTLILFIFLSISNFITFKLMTSPQAASFLMFLPWWFIRTMVVDKLGWVDLELRRQYYLSLGTWNAYLRVIQFETMAFCLFLVGNLGMRVLGFYEFVKGFVKGRIFIDSFEIMFATTMITGFIVPLFFVQKGIIYNNIQFMQYFIFIFGFYGAISVYKITKFFKNRSLKLTLVILIVCLSIPTVIGNLNEFYGPNRTALARISNNELKALNYLKLNSSDDSVVLTVPFNDELKNKFIHQPKPIYAWYSTPYVSAISARRTYLTAQEQALITGYPFDGRLLNMKKFFEQKDFNFNKKFLKEAKINYIYLAKSQIERPVDLVNNNLMPFFENEEVLIYKVNKFVE